MANDTRERTDRPMTEAPAADAATAFLIEGDPFERREPDALAREREPEVHVYGKGTAKRVCRTDTRGFPQPQNRSPLEIVVDASGGFVPLWEPNTVLRYRFQRRSKGSPSIRKSVAAPAKASAAGRSSGRSRVSFAMVPLLFSGSSRH